MNNLITCSVGIGVLRVLQDHEVSSVIQVSRKLKYSRCVVRALL